MRLESYRDADHGHERSGRRRRYRRATVDWDSAAHDPYYSLPHRRHDKVHRSGRTTSRRSQTSSPGTLDSPESAMPPPPHLTWSSADAYRRPRHWMAYEGDRGSFDDRRRPRRDEPPAYSFHPPPPEYSPRSSATGLACGAVEEPDEQSKHHGSFQDNDDDNHIEVVEVVDESSSSQHKRDRQSSRDDYMTSSDDRRHHRRQRRQRDSDRDLVMPRRRHSHAGSPARESSRTADRSRSSHRGRHAYAIDVIEDSRPPVSSKRSILGRIHRSAEAIYDDKHRSSSRTRPSRSRAGSMSGGPSGILSSIFGTAPSRRVSLESYFKEPKATKRVECVICMGDVSAAKAAKLNCGHCMCRSCLERVFKLSLTDPQHMPPRCCTQEHIPLKHVDRLFDESFKKTWNRKFAEFSTKNRLYCPSRKCGEWIKPTHVRKENGRNVARCGRCRTKVCCLCNGKWHGSGDCPQDEETTRLLAQAQQEGWKRCYRCKAMVELKEGCNHMTCRCGAEFCMICGVKWKGCDCPWFNDGGFLGDMADVPIPQIRGDLRDIFVGDGPPVPVELRDWHPVTMTLPARQRPVGHQEEMLRRRLQGQRDVDPNRNLQYPEGTLHEEHDMNGGVGEIHGIGNAAGHLMNDDYRGAARFRVPMPPPPTTPRVATLERSSDYLQDLSRTRSRRAGSMERRLADRLSESRPGRGMHPRVDTMSGSMRAPHLDHAPDSSIGPPPTSQGRTLRHHGLDDELYNRRPSTARSERVVGARLSRTYEDEIEIHAPPSRRRAHEEPPRSSDMAGLNGPGQGMNRVSQWRSFVEPGVPDGESTVGHA
ncbi:hypothetical protein HIM_00526 [Hirsutella minnesotensis 3608]|nr:hypothetical protein HIM_00526 [Hirsutella minnesotensis 3608]